MYHVLIVEDEPDISRIVRLYLEDAGMECTVAEDGFSALSLFGSGHYDLLILDVMMPGIDGFQVMRTIRNTSDVPVIFLTARNEEADRLEGFDTGADDYVVKPFSPKVLVKRVLALLYRVYGQDGTDNEFGPFVLDENRMTLMRDGVDLELSVAEYRLIRVFVKNPERILSREQLMDSAFGIDYEGFDRNIDSLIKRLRRKIETDSKHPQWITTKYGAGYIFHREG